MTEFAKRVASKDGLQHKCKLCQAILAKNKDYKAYYKNYNREYAIKNKYGLSIEQYENTLSRGCEICSGTDRLVLDHCHKTGRVRGCLCHNCNTALGLLKDDVVKLNKAIIYLTEN